MLALLGRDLCAGFALAGVDVSVAEDPVGARSALDAAIAGRQYGIVIVEEELMAGMEQEVREAYGSSTVPLVIEIPGTMAWREIAEAPSDDYIAKLIRRAVGYQLNIKL
ncbi:MAG: V-type ATP synthase subunit F [Spirochaetia bacterium]